MHLAALSVALAALSYLQCVNAQSSGSGYTDYSLKLSGDSDSLVYATDSTDTSNGTANVRLIESLPSNTDIVLVSST